MTEMTAEYLKANATHIETVCGIHFYEDPRYGDEAGLWAVYQGKSYPTDYFHAPDADEIGDVRDFLECYST